MIRPPFRRLAVLLLAAAGLLAGCAGDPAAPDGVPGLAVHSRVIGPGDYVEVLADHRSLDHRVEEVALVDPDGTAHPARDFERETVRYDSGPGGAFGVGGGAFGSGGTNIGAGVSLGFPLDGQALYRTRATMAVPDPETYRRAPEAWRIRVVVEHRSGTQKIIERPAPVPE